MAVGVVVNPVAGSGRMRRMWPAVRAALQRHFGELVVEETAAVGEASLYARKLALDGVELVIAAGGDGTISEVADGLLRAGGGVQLGIMPAGTGSDLSRFLGLDGDIEAAAARIASGSTRKIDVGCVDYIDEHGALASRHFINISSLGLSGPTARAVNNSRTGDRVSGKALFLWHTVRELIRYRFQDVRIAVDDQPSFDARIAVVAVANGRFFGGGMMVAPDAALDDGLLEIVVVHGRSKPSLLMDLRLVYTGSHRGHPSCTFLRGRKVVIEPIGDPLANGALLEVDGESPGHIPATFTIKPGALTLRC